ncbi:hypothetical protein MNBD_GAMMA24-330, partial [hydrothermal vent metagenome]
MQIKMSDNARPVLEALQSQSLDAVGLDSAKLDPTELSRKLLDELSGRGLQGEGLHDTRDRHLKYIQSVVENLPTPYEDPRAYIQLSLLVTAVAKAARTLGHQLPDTISLGTVPSGNVNAHVITINPAARDYLLVFNRQTLRFTEWFSRLIASWIEAHVGRGESQFGQAFEPSESDIELLDRLILYVICRVELFRDDKGEVTHAVLDGVLDDPPPLPNLTSTVSARNKDILYFSMTAFIVAHEFAHIVQIEKPRTPAHIVANDFMNELACDAIGCLISAQSATEQFDERSAPGWQLFGTVGSLFFLSSLELLEKAEHIFAHGSPLPQFLLEPS